jgi:hypothetical protein
MSVTPSPIPPDLDEAGQGLRQVLLRLNRYAQSQVQRLDPAARYATSTMAHVKDLEALLMAVEHYEQAVLASLPPAPMDLRRLTPAQLLAHRETDPVYRLGYTRGYQAGAAQAQRSTAPVLTAYAQHATLPGPTVAPPAAHTDLVKHVRNLLAQMTQRYGKGPISQYTSTAQLYGAY